jgi:hypothetical protein
VSRGFPLRCQSPLSFCFQRWAEYFFAHFLEYYPSGNQRWQWHINWISYDIIWYHDKWRCITFYNWDITSSVNGKSPILWRKMDPPRRQGDSPRRCGARCRVWTRYRFRMDRQAPSGRSAYDWAHGTRSGAERGPLLVDDDREFYYSIYIYIHICVYIYIYYIEDGIIIIMAIQDLGDHFSTQPFCVGFENSQGFGMFLVLGGTRLVWRPVVGSDTPCAFPGDFRFKQPPCQFS